MTPADIRRQVVVEELDLSRDGRTAVVVRRTIHGIRYHGTLLAVPLDGRGAGIARPRILTSGVVRDTRPRISPDGGTVAFVRTDPADDDAPATLTLIGIDGGRVRSVRRGRHGGVGEVAWSPDGTRIAFTAEVDPPRWLVGPVARVGTTDKDGPRARRIDRIDWRWDEEGHLDRWSHLWVVDLERGATPRQVTAGDWGVSDIAWHPDGTDRGLHERPRTAPGPGAAPHDLGGGRGRVRRTGDRGEPREVLAPGGYAIKPSVSPDGRWVAAIGVLEAEPLDDISPTVVVAPADGSRAGQAGRPRPGPRSAHRQLDRQRPDGLDGLGPAWSGLGG